MESEYSGRIEQGKRKDRTGNEMKRKVGQGREEKKEG
jgi:hypothetical protein